ncbi:MAG: outer membrane beta-barrel protein [Prevotellaceae bacterium]|nr:outer membrane beta-barrel protein [Prevotellaceae bacterium]
MQRVLIMIVGMLALGMQAHAQQIDGRVTDRAGQALEFANVVLMADSAFVTGVITNAEGYFEMNVSADKGNRIEVSSVGYESRSLDVPPTGHLGTVVLEESQVMLGEVVVRSAIPATQMKGSTLVTTVENSVLSKMGTAADVLSRLPLVKEEDGAFTVFGKGTPLVYINGKLVRSPNELQRLSSESIRSVEVITNPGSQYSAEVQSVIRIKTIPQRGEGFSADLYDGLRVSHFARNTTEVSLNYRHDRIDLFAEGEAYLGKRRYVDSSGMTTFDENTLQQSIDTKSDRTFNDISGKIGVDYQLSADQSIGAYYGLEREHTRTHADPLSQIDLLGEGGPLSSETISSDWISTTDTWPVHEFNGYYTGTVGKLDIDFNADFTQSRAHSHDTHDERNLTYPVENRYIVSEGLKKSRLLAEKLIVSHPLWKGSLEVGEEYTNSRLGYGYDYDGVSIDDSSTRIVENNVAAFATVMQGFGKVNLSAGLRYEHVDYAYFDEGVRSTDRSKTYSNFFPTFSLATVLGKARLSVSFTDRTQRPSYSQLDGGIQYVNNFTYQCGNPKLQPVKKYNVQVMGMWKWLLGQAAVNHDVNAIFWNTTTYGEDDSVKMLSYENVPHYTQMQVALGAQPVIGCWKPQAVVGVIKQFYSTTYRGEKLHMGKPLFSFTLNNTFSLPHSWTLSADLQFTSAGNMQNMHTSATNEIDLMVSKSFFKDNFTVSLYANDLFDGSAAHTTLYSGDILTRLYNKAEQRNVRLTLRYKFNTARSKYKGTGAGESEKERM